MQMEHTPRGVWDLVSKLTKPQMLRYLAAIATAMCPKFLTIHREAQIKVSGADTLVGAGPPDPLSRMKSALTRHRTPARPSPVPSRLHSVMAYLLLNPPMPECSGLLSLSRRLGDLQVTKERHRL